MKKIHLILLTVIILALTGQTYSQTYLDAEQQFVSSYPQNINSTDLRTIYLGLGNITLDAANNYKPDLVQVVNYTLYAPPVQEFHSFCGWNENSGNINFGGDNQIFLQTPPSNVVFNKGLAFAKIRSSIVQHPKLKDFVVLKDDALKLFLVNNDASVVEGQSFVYSNGYYTAAGEFNWQDILEDVFVYRSLVIKGVTRYFVSIYKANGDVYPYIGETSYYDAEVNAPGLFPKLIVKRINESDGAYLFGNQSPGKPDLIVKDDNTVKIFSNDDNNHLVLTKTITPGYTIFDVAVEDVNNDGYNDIILSEFVSGPSSRVQIFLNTKSGDYFGNSASITIQNSSAISFRPAISIADFNVDGFNDLIISSTQKASIFINQDGSFTSTPNQSFEHFQEPVKSIAADLNGKGGISLLINGARAITYNNQQLWDIEGITRFNPTDNYSNPKPAPPAVERRAYKDGVNYHPLIKFNNRSELDFKEYKIYKRLEGYYQYQLVATLNNQYNEFIDYDEIVYEDCFLPPSYYTSLVYKVTSSDLDNQESDPSPEMKYRTLQGGDGDGFVVNPETPKQFNLSQNYPNPFNPVTKINFALPKQGFVTLKIYDITGREIQTLVSEVKQAGYYSVDFNGSVLSSGVYFYKIQSGDFISVKRMVLIK
ncbi:MAG: FG-GAP-like repeat-containing protein [Ignavibacteriae bacterium]|nr:FG-GAP-like repeat-containing protein [Ignavibacteriota bacterium]